MTKKVLIIGSTGFMGSNLVGTLIAERKKSKYYLN